MRLIEIGDSCTVNIRGIVPDEYTNGCVVIMTADEWKTLLEVSRKQGLSITLMGQVINE